jgi:hypothetical protein
VTVSRIVASFDLDVRRSPSEQWMLRSRHDTRADLRVAIVKLGPSVYWRVRKTTRRVVGFKQPDRPTAARAHRESVADAMTVRAQAMKLYKSSANGTELASIPEEGVIK